MAEELPKGIMNMLSELGKMSEEQGGQQLGTKEDSKKQQNIRWAAMKEVGLQTKEALDRFFGTTKGLDPKIKNILRTTYRLAQPTTIPREKRSKGGMIDYRKTGMFK